MAPPASTDYPTPPMAPPASTDTLTPPCPSHTAKILASLEPARIAALADYKYLIAEQLAYPGNAFIADAYTTYRDAYLVCHDASFLAWETHVLAIDAWNEFLANQEPPPKQ